MARRRGKYDETPPAIRLAALDRDGWQCQRCGLGNGRAALEVHHLTPLAAGGTNDLANLETLCRGCHANHHKDLLAAQSPVYAKRREWSRAVKELQNERELTRGACR